ncbi:MAG TPA: S4 domain-containing protein [Gemmatimonadales bacterium]|nr:S4 domain-containing protein [Gemmatimonadales bacterium]
MSEEKVRLDKWLWAARFYKTRALAVEGIDGGKVRVNGDRVKRAKQIGTGDAIAIRLGPYEHTVLVRGLSERRGPATEAVKLYEETAESIAGRERTAFQLKAAHALFVDSNERPTKRDRRALEKFRRQVRGEPE